MELAFPFFNRENQVYSERSSLNAWLIQYPLPSAGASYAMFLSIHTIIYKQTFRKTGRKGNFIDEAPLSSRFYEYLFRDCCDYRMEKLSIG